MARARTVYRCTQCGADSLKWSGQCAGCGAWNTLAEEIAETKRSTAVRRNGAHSVRLDAVVSSGSPRWQTGMHELDFVLGGGLVPGSMVLVGGEPGIGKSTLLLQAAALLQGRGFEVLYVSGEESAEQIKLRATRLEENADGVSLLGATSLEEIIGIAENDRPRVMIVDSIQTIATDAFEGAPGSVGQVRECAARLMRFAKESGIAVIIVGHVTKDGGIAGPKTSSRISSAESSITSSSIFRARPERRKQP
jgi:DNA repair protein RadA/Sms